MILNLQKKVTSWFKPEGYMSRKEAAAYLGVSVPTVRMYEYKGVLTSCKFENAGNVSYYKNEDLKAFKKLRSKELGKD